MILEELRALIGAPPEGYEFLEYLFVGLFCLMIVQSCITLISGLFCKFSGGDKR